MKKTTRQRPLAVTLMTIAGAGLLASCGPSSADFQQLKAEADSARSDAQTERRGREEAEQRSKSVEREVKHLKEELDGAKQDRDKLEDVVKKLDKEFTEYKEKYKAAMLQKVPGLTIKPLVYDKKSYDNLVVRNIDGDSLILSNPNGLLHLKTADLPVETQAFLALDQKTEFHSKVATFLKDFDKHKLLASGIVPTEDKPKSNKTTGLVKETKEPRPNAFDAELMKFIAQITSSAADGTTAVGYGFIAKQGNGVYFYTNAHLVAGANSLSTVTTDGRRFTVPETFEMADEDEAFDIVRFKLGASGIPSLELAEGSDAAKVGDKIIALGESGSAGYSASGPILENTIRAMGAFWVDAETATLRGTTGGPLLLDGTTKVVGIITHWANPIGYHGDPSYGTSPLSGVSRVCLRPDQVNKWRTSSLSRLAQEPRILDQIETDNNVLQSLMGVTFGEQGITGLDADSMLAGGKSSIGIALANSMRNVNAFFSRVRPSTGKGGKVVSIAPTAIREQCALFVTAVLQVYGSGIAGADENSYSRFSRARFHQLAEKRRSICLSLRAHLDGEISRIDPYHK